MRIDLRPALPRWYGWTPPITKEPKSNEAYLRKTVLILSGLVITFMLTTILALVL